MATRTDAFLTLLLMDRGAYEVNPIMAYALSVNTSAFVASKYVLTCIAALIVLMLRDVVVVPLSYNLCHSNT